MTVRSWIYAFFAAWLGLMAVSTPAEAQSNEDKKKAGEFFSRGEALFENGKYLKAAKAFSSAYELAPHPSVLVNIGLSYDKAQKYPEAVHAYREYMETMAADQVEGWVGERLEELYKRIGQLHVNCPAENCQVSVDGVKAGWPPVDVLIDPGDHNVEAFVDGRSIANVEVFVDAGSKASVTMVRSEVPMEPAGEGWGPSEDWDRGKDGDDGAKLGIPFWITSGVAVASGAVALGFGLKTSALKEEWNASDNPPQSLMEEGERFRTLTNVFIGVAAGAAAAAVGFAIYDLTAGADDDDDGDKDNDTAVVATPLRDGGFAATLVVRF